MEATTAAVIETATRKGFTPEEIATSSTNIIRSFTNDMARIRKQNKSLSVKEILFTVAEGWANEFDQATAELALGLTVDFLNEADRLAA